MAETIILIRRSGISGSAPSSGSLRVGELALNTTDGGLFYHNTGSDTPELIRAGTASFALNAAVSGGSTDSSSWAETASYAEVAQTLLGSIESASWAETASFASSVIKEEHFTVYSSEPAKTVLINQTESLFEYGPEFRKKMVLNTYTQARVSTIVHDAGYASSSLAIQYSANDGNDWDFMNGSTAPSLSLAVTGNIAGEWVDIVSESKSDILLRWVTQGGDSVESPSIGSIILTIR